MNKDKDPKDRPPTTFRDDPPPQRCPECQAPALAITGGEARCAAGHTWNVVERRVRG